MVIKLNINGLELRRVLALSSSFPCFPSLNIWLQSKQMRRNTWTLEQDGVPSTTSQPPPRIPPYLCWTALTRIMISLRTHPQLLEKMHPTSLTKTSPGRKNWKLPSWEAKNGLKTKPRTSRYLVRSLICFPKRGNACHPTVMAEDKFSVENPTQ